MIIRLKQQGASQEKQEKVKGRGAEGSAPYRGRKKNAPPAGVRDGASQEKGASQNNKKKKRPGLPRSAPSTINSHTMGHPIEKGAFYICTNNINITPWNTTGDPWNITTIITITTWNSIAGLCPL